jgi:MFS family permease
MPEASRRVIRSYFAIAGLYTLAASIIWGVNTLFLLDAGLSIGQVFIANAAFSAGTVLFEIPTGVVADTLGRRVSFLFSVAVLAVTTLAYVGLAEIEGGLLEFCLVSVFMGLGFTFYSGAVEAWLVDALNDTGFDGMLDRVFAQGQMVTGGAMLIGTVGGGLLGTANLAFPFIARAVMLVILFGLAMSLMRDIGFTPRRLALSAMPREMGAVARSSVDFGWKRKELRLLMMASFLGSAFFAWGFYAWQPYILDLLGRDAVWVAGVVSALIAVSTMMGNALVEWFTRFCGHRTTLIVGAVAVQSVAAVIVGLTTNFWVAVPVFLLITAGLGVVRPVRQAYFHKVIPTEQRATVISFDSMVSGVGGVGGQVGLGALAQAQSISAGYVAGGFITALALPLVLAVRRIGSPADQIIGTNAGVESLCAAQGLPAVSAVDTELPLPVLPAPEDDE